MTHNQDSCFRVGSTSDQAMLDFPIFSGFGQFSLYILSLGKQAQARLFSTADTLAEQLQRRQRPRRDNVDGFARRCPQSLRSAARGQWRERQSPARPRAGRRPSCRCSRPGGPSRLRSSASAQAIDEPGKAGAGAEVDPDFARPGPKRRSCSESATWRVQIAGIVERAIRFVCFCQVEQQLDERSSRADVSRETGVSGQGTFAVGGKVERLARSSCPRRSRSCGAAIALAACRAGHARPATSAPPA